MDRDQFTVDTGNGIRGSLVRDITLTFQGVQFTWLVGGGTKDDNLGSGA